MSFERIAHRRCGRSISLKQTLLIMKFIVVFMLAACLQVTAKGLGQAISISEKNVSLPQLFRQIQRQAPYDFVYSVELLREAGPVSVAVRNANIEEVMRACLRDKSLSYEVIGKTIVVKGMRAEQQTGQMIMMAALPPEAIRGTVVDEKGNPVVGATVVPKWPKGVYSSNVLPPGTATNDKGEFRFYNMSTAVNLVISSIGYKTVEIAVNRQVNPMRIVLIAEEAELKEMVITGYSTKKVSEVTGSVQSFSGDELRNGVSTVNVLAMLKGKTAGLYIVEGGTSPGSVSSRGQVVMRGQASLADGENSNFGPLIVLDGVITTSTNLQDIVDANDIETITLLKDAASTAIYGSRAAAGVLVVTTRRGKIGKPVVNLNMNYGRVESKRLINFMSTTQLTTHIRKWMELLYATTPTLQTTYGSFDNYFNTTRPFTDEDLKTNYDWNSNVFFPDGNQRDVNLSVSSGTDKTKFYGSVKWLKQDGTLLDDNLDRKNIRFNIDQKLSDKLSVGFNVNAIIDKYTGSTGDNQTFYYQPWVTPYNADGSVADSIPNYTYRATGSRVRGWSTNPLYQHQWNTAITNRQSYLGTGFIKYAVTPWLTLQSTNTFQYIYNNVNSYRDPRTYRGRYNGAATNPVFMNGELTIADTRTSYMLTSNLASFSKKFGDHHLTALVGQEYGKTTDEFQNLSAYNTPYPGERNLGAFLNYGNGSTTWINVMQGRPINVNSPATVEKLSYSIFSEINDNYKGKYFGSVSFRRDGSSNFGRNSRYGKFYSVSGSWLASKESFLASSSVVSNLKLRASYGSSGREAGRNFLNFTTYGESANYAYNTPTTTGSAILLLGNNELTWETTYTTNIGFDLGLWKRINLSVDLYNRASKGLLQTTILPSYQGGMSQARNVGEIRNRGIDILLSTINIESRDFSWTTDFNINFNGNKLTKLYGDSLRDAFSGAYYRYVGEDMNTFRAIKYAGVNADNGRPLFERVMADKSITLVDSIPTVKADGLRGYQVAGSATPKFFGGFTNTFRYKGFTLSALFNFVYGNKIYNRQLVNFISPTVWTQGYNMHDPGNKLRFWQGPGDNGAVYPNYYDINFATRGATNINSSLMYQDASYLRLRNIKLAYQVPNKLMKKMGIGSASVYVSADNVFVIKSAELYAADPEGASIGSIGGDFAGTGISSAMPRRWLAGINVSF